MTSKITINIETDDTDLVERVGRALNGNLTEIYERVPAEEHDHIDDADYPEVAEGEVDAASSHTQGAETATGQESTADSTAGGDAPRDQRGVAFNNHYCGQARDPFYSSGKRSGQWKKKKGVSDGFYDDWYAEELAALAGGGEQERQTETVNTAGAFGGQTQQQDAPPAPTSTGEFMGWVAEKQAAGLITQDDIQQAYGAVGCQVADLFPPNDHAAIAKAIGGLHHVLSQKAGA